MLRATCASRRSPRCGLRISAIVTEADLAAYDALRNGQAHTLEAESIVGIGEALIKARIMRNRGTTLLTPTYVPAERAQAQAISVFRTTAAGPIRGSCACLNASCNA